MDMLESGFPTNKIITKFMLHHLKEGLIIAQSTNFKVDATLAIWAKANIPVYRIDSGIKKLQKMRNNYCEFKSHRLTPKEVTDTKKIYLRLI